VTVDVVGPENPIVKALAPSFQVNDEIYQISDFQYKDTHVLLRLDPASVDLNKPGAHWRFYGWPLAWTRYVGQGRVFYTALGHEEIVVVPANVAKGNHVDDGAADPMSKARAAGSTGACTILSQWPAAVGSAPTLSKP